MYNTEVIWPDINGVHINAHGGGILYHQNRYYWYGEHKIEGWEGRLAYHGVYCYSSVDLQNWADEGIVLKVKAESSSPICQGCRIERPKVIFNKATNKFIMWFHSSNEEHTIANSGVAVASSPIGPYHFIEAFRPNAGYWPLNVNDADQNQKTAKDALPESSYSNGENEFIIDHNILGRDFANGQMARDMNLFVDDDGQAYHIYASEHNSTLHISRLSEDYLGYSGEYVRIFPNRWMEAPALFKRQGLYYLLMSGCTSWAPNAARGAVAEHIFGPWREIDNPCSGINPNNGFDEEKTFGAQSTFVLKIPHKDYYVAMFDVWEPKNFINSHYLWLPIYFTKNDYVVPWSKTYNID